MRGDHVHFTRDGGDRIGALIDADLTRAAESVRRASDPRAAGALTCCSRP